MKGQKNKPEVVAKAQKKMRTKKADVGLSTLQITDITDADKRAFRAFKNGRGIKTNGEAFRCLLQTAKQFDNQDYYIV